MQILPELSNKEQIRAPQTIKEPEKVAKPSNGWLLCEIIVIGCVKLVSD